MLEIFDLMSYSFIDSSEKWPSKKLSTTIISLKIRFH